MRLKHLKKVVQWLNCLFFGQSYIKPTTRATQKIPLTGLTRSLFFSFRSSGISYGTVALGTASYLISHPEIVHDDDVSLLHEGVSFLRAHVVSCLQGFEDQYGRPPPRPSKTAIRKRKEWIGRMAGWIR